MPTQKRKQRQRKNNEAVHDYDEDKQTDAPGLRKLWYGKPNITLPQRQINMNMKVLNQTQLE